VEEGEMDRAAQLDKAARCFLTASSRRISLRYAPSLRSEANPAEVLKVAEEALGGLEKLFGELTSPWPWRTFGPLLSRQRVVVYLFPTAEAIQTLFGWIYAAAALPERHAVVVPFRQPRLDCFGTGFQLDEVLKHEKTHLFAARWNPLPPPLLGEGLATWLQGTNYGYTIDSAAVQLVRQEEACLWMLLDREFFFDRANTFRCYVLAGSFSGFLIREFGWEAYKALYRHARNDRPFGPLFLERLCLTLEEAEGQWRDGLIKKYEAPVKVWN
jgi:hypothetical protein